MSDIFTTTIQSLRPLHDNILVSEMNFHERTTSSGIVIPSDDAKNSGIRPRWAKVHAVGPAQNDVKVGQWICVAHGRWTRGIKINMSGVEEVIRRVDPNDVLLVSDTEPMDEIVSDKV